MAQAGSGGGKPVGVKSLLDFVYIPDLSADGAENKLRDILRSENNSIHSENIHVNFIPEKVGFDQKRSICSVLIFFKCVDPESLERMKTRRSPAETATE